LSHTTTEPDEHATARALIEEAERVYRASDYAGSGELTQRAATLARRCGDAGILGRALVNAGRLAGIAGQTLPAYEAASEAYRLLGDSGDVTRQLQALSVCAAVHDQCDDQAACIDLLRRGLSMAVGSEHASIRVTLLHNLAVTLSDKGEHVEALQCLTEASEIVSTAPKSARQKETIAARLALEHQLYARHLHDQGRDAEAERERQAACRRLPPMPQVSWRSASPHDAYCFNQQVELRAALGEWEAARFAAAMGIRFARRRAGAVLNFGWALVSAAKLYRSTQQFERAIRSEQRALATWRDAGLVSRTLESLQRISQLHALIGDHRRALALRKEWVSLHSHQRLEAAALRCRLAAIERQLDRRRRQAEEAAAHAQRLAIIGRLIAQTHYALSAPIARTNELTAQALAHGATPDALPPLLGGINQAIDRAAGLVSQLKLFSYRSSPQPMALSLHESLLEAWQGLDPHIGSRTAGLQISGHTHLQVWGDAQRLSIMLKVLLIELIQRAGGGAAAVAIAARIDTGSADTVLLRIEAGAGAAAPIAATAAASLGTALCVEIAAEMQGELHAVGDADAMPCYRLCLPAAEPHRHTPGNALAPSVGLSRL
jgi:C4-dicarboxylate-specific signal transduction histidine kinase